MKDPKAKITVSIDVSLIVWIDDQVKKGVFKSRSESIQHYILAAYMTDMTLRGMIMEHEPSEIYVSVSARKLLEKVRDTMARVTGRPMTYSHAIKYLCDFQEIKFLSTEEKDKIDAELW